MKTGAFRVKRWISLGLLLVFALSFAVPTFALPYRWYKNVYVHKNPSKMTYKVGEYMDLAGLELWGDVYDENGNFVFTNDDMSHLESKYFKYSPAQFTKAGKQKVTFSCWCVAKSGEREWLSTSITVTVKEEEGDPPVEWYTDIFVAAQPKKTIYTVGESFKTSGLSLSGHVYNALDGKKHTVTKLSQKDMKISPTKFTKPGKQDVKLSLYLLSKSGEHKWFSTTVQVLVEKAAIKITKHPYGETVNVGGACNFTARADNIDSRHWFFTKGDAVVDSVDAPAHFPGLTVSGTTAEKLKLSNIPASLDGWAVYCVFYGSDTSASTDKASIYVLSGGSTTAPSTQVPVTPPPTAVPPTKVPVTPPPTAAPATAAPTKASASTSDKPATAYVEGIHCTVNGQSRVSIQGTTTVQCQAEDIAGFVFDHWEIDGVAEYGIGASASFTVSKACVIRAYYHERRVLRTVNCYLQLLTKSNNASGDKYKEFDFEEAYYNPVTKAYCPAGTLSCYVTAVIPKKAQVDYWLINGVKYQFPANKITKFRILDLNEATTIEPVFKGKTPTNANARPAIARELEKQVLPRMMHCINCWGQFMNASGKPSGKEYTEFNFDQTFTNPVTGKSLPGGLLDIYIATKEPRGQTVETWIINNVKYQFPQHVIQFRVLGLDEDTTYEVRFRNASSPTRVPGTVYR